MSYSVLMSVYHKEKASNLEEAMESMWQQSVPTDDFVLVCDGSLNKELDAVIEKMESQHSALTVVRLKNNQGLGTALNIGLGHCKNELICRMDSDDISMSYRCEKQMAVFDNNPDIGLCSGTVLEFSNDIDNITGRRSLPHTDKLIRRFSRKRNPMNHPAAMFRREAVEKAGGYSEEFHFFEDYHLWVRMLQKGTRAYNLEEPLVYMRTSKDMYKRRGGKEYALDMLRFHKWLRDIQWSSAADYVIGALPHAIVCLLPNSVRRVSYSLLHR